MKQSFIMINKVLVKISNKNNLIAKGDYKNIINNMN